MIGYDSRDPLGLETLTPHTTYSTVSCNVFPPHPLQYCAQHGCDGLRHISHPTELEILANRDASFPSGWIAHANGPIPVILAGISGFKLQIQISFNLLDRPSNSAGILDLPALTSYASFAPCFSLDSGRSGPRRSYRKCHPECPSIRDP